MSKQRKSNFRKQTVSDAKRQKRQASSYGYLNLPKGVKVFSLKEKTREILLDILPYVVTDSNHPDRDSDEGRAVPDSLWYKRPFKIHRNVGSDNNSVVCLSSVKKKCPICVYVADQRRQGVDWDDLKDIAAKDRNLYVVRPIDSDDHDEVVHIWDMSHYLFQNELTDQLEENEENGIFPDLEEGTTLKIKFRWKTLGKNSYPETRDISFEEREQQYTEDILDEVPNLDEILNILSYKELDAKFLEMENEAAEEDDDVTETDDEPTRQRKTVEPKDEEEKDDKPKRTRTKPSKEEKKDKCPHGLKFGKDCARDKICDECDLWDVCDEEQEKQEK